MPAHATPANDLETIRDRYLQRVLGGDASEYGNPLGEEQLDTLRFDEPNPPLYNTTKAGADQKEVHFLITNALRALTVAYHVQGSAKIQNPWHQHPEVKGKIVQIFDHLHRRGFRHPMHLPWKPQQVKSPDPQQAKGVQYASRGKTEVGPPMMPVTTPVTLTLHGTWMLKGPSTQVAATLDGNQTRLTIPCEDARSIGFLLAPGTAQNDSATRLNAASGNHLY